MEWMYYHDRVILIKQVEGHFIDDWKPIVGFRIKQDIQREYRASLNELIVNYNLQYSEPTTC